MKLLASFAALISLTAAAPQRLSPPLDVQLQMDGNSAVKATITNYGKKNLKIFKTGTLLDNSAIQKTRITDADGKAVAFQGIRQRISTQSLADDAFQKIPGNKSIEVTFNVGEVHDLSAGGDFDIHSSGFMHIASENNTIIGSVPYRSNAIKASVNGTQAASMFSSFANLVKRTNVQNDCVGEKRTVTENALSGCARLARSAQSAASSNDAKVQEYFKDSSPSTKSAVADAFGKIAAECSSASSGTSKCTCNDVASYCKDGVLAYTLTGESVQSYCPAYFNKLPDLTSQCHTQDKATTNLHETSHLPEILGTTDHGYGYQSATGLDTKTALNNADTYSLFANAIHANC